MPLFDRDRYQRLPLDVSSGGGGGARRPASSCASTTIILFVGLCLVGAWMMASTTTTNVAMNVSPENKDEDDRSADLTRSVVNGGKVDDDGPGDTTQTGDAAGAGDTSNKDGGSGAVQTTEDAAGNEDGERQQGRGGSEGDTPPQTTENAGKEGDDGPGDTLQTGDAAAGDTGKKDDDGGAVQTTEAAVDQSGVVVAGPVDAAANSTTGGKPDGDTVVGAGESPSKNLTFSDESGMTEGGDVARPDGTDKKAQNSTEEATTGVQTDKSAEDAATGTDQKGDSNAGQNTEEAPRDTTNTGDQVGKSSDNAETDDQEEKNAEAAPTEKKEEDTDGQADNIADKSSAEETPAFAKDTGDDGTGKNQTDFDDHNGNLDGDRNGDKVIGDDTAASSDQTSVDQNDAPKNQTSGAALDDKVSQEAEMVPSNSSTTTTEGEEKPVTEPVTGGDAEAAELLPSGHAELLNETTTAAAQDGTFPTQATESNEEKKKARASSSSNKNSNGGVVVDGGVLVRVEALQREHRRGLHPVPGQRGGHQAPAEHQALRTPRAALPVPGAVVPSATAGGVPAPDPVAGEPGQDLVQQRAVHEAGVVQGAPELGAGLRRRRAPAVPGRRHAVPQRRVSLHRRDPGGAPGGGVGQPQPRGAGRGLRRGELRRVPLRQGRADHVVRPQGRARGAGAVRAGARHPGHRRRDGHPAAPVPGRRLRRGALRAVPRAVAHRGGKAAAGGEPAPPPRWPLRVVSDAGVPEGRGERRDLAGHGRAHQVHVLGDGGQDQRHGGPDRPGHLQEAVQQRLLRQEEPPGASAVRGVRQPQRRMEHNAAGVHAQSAHERGVARLAVAGAVAGEADDGALLAGRQPGRRLRQARAGGLRGGHGALEEGRQQLVPRRHGHRLEQREERHGHAVRLRRIGGGAAGDEGVGDEHRAGGRAGHAAHHLRARAVRDVPRLVRVLQHLPEVLRSRPRQPSLLQAQVQVQAEAGDRRGGPDPEARGEDDRPRRQGDGGGGREDREISAVGGQDGRVQRGGEAALLRKDHVATHPSRSTELAQAIYFNNEGK